MICVQGESKLPQSNVLFRLVIADKIVLCTKSSMV
jgi:hypothetical protein